MKSIPSLFYFLIIAWMLQSSLPAETVSRKLSRCATPPPNKSLIALHNSSVAFSKDNPSRLSIGSVVIPVQFHIVKYDNGAGDVTDQQIFDQIDCLNQAFQGTRYRFNYFGVTRSNNSYWTTGTIESQAEMEMKNVLGISPATTLNVFVCADPGARGWAYFPGYFQEICDESNPQDYCEDTPGHIRNSGTPSETTDTCELIAGYDPVHNYMNYVDDQWMTEFTSDQRYRSYFIVSDLKPTLWNNATGNNDGIFANLSTRAKIGSGDETLISGIIITGQGSRKLLFRSIGPSLSPGITNPIPNPRAELQAYIGGSWSVISNNDDWRNPVENETEVTGSSLPPSNDLEAAFVETLAPGAYILKRLTDFRYVLGIESSVSASILGILGSVSRYVPSNQ